MNLVDLHVHSDKSDGSLSPCALVDLALLKGLSAFALTDHDTTAGTAEAMAAGEETGVRVIPGIEVSSSYEDKELHILGLFVHPGEAGFEDFLKAMRARRDRRNEEMLARFARDGITFTQEERGLMLDSVAWQGAIMGGISICLFLGTLLTGGEDANGRIDGFFQYANTYALFLLCLLCSMVLIQGVYLKLGVGKHPGRSPKNASL